MTETESEQLLNKFERGGFLRKLDSCGDITRFLKKYWEFKEISLLAIKGNQLNIVTTTKMLMPVQAFLKAVTARYALFLGDILLFLYAS